MEFQSSSGRSYISGVQLELKGFHIYLPLGPALVSLLVEGVCCLQSLVASLFLFFSLFSFVCVIWQFGGVVCCCLGSIPFSSQYIDTQISCVFEKNIHSPYSTKRKCAYEYIVPNRCKETCNLITNWQWQLNKQASYFKVLVHRYHDDNKFCQETGQR